MNWNLVKNVLPEIGQEVLCFYKIGDFEYFCVGSIRMISSQITGTAGNYTEYKSVEWKDNNGDIIQPTYWFPVEPPSNLTTGAVDLLESSEKSASLAEPANH